MPSGLGNFPSINELLESPPLKALVDRVNPARVMTSVRSFVEGMRQEVTNAVTQRQIPSPMALAEQIAQWIMRQEDAGVRSVLNATGILFHPEIGGPPLSDEALAALREAAGSYSQVAAAGKTSVVQQQLQKLIGCEAAIVTGSSSLALSLATVAIACGKDVLVPRCQMSTDLNGERTYELISAAGGRIREIGAANSLQLEDLAVAAEGEIAFLFWQQDLPYQFTGHQQSIGLSEAAAWASRRGISVVVDLGRGGLQDCTAFGLEPQPTAGAALQAGATAVILRGDGLLGGPACGLIAGKNSLVSRIAAHPLTRTAVAEKLTLAALAATLDAYATSGEELATRVERAIPLLGLLATSADNLKHRAERLAPQLAASPALGAVEPRSDSAFLSSAKLPNEKLPTWGLTLSPAQGTAAELLAALRQTTPAIFGVLAGDLVWLDLRAISPREDQLLVLAIEQLGKPRAAE